MSRGRRSPRARRPGPARASRWGGIPRWRSRTRAASYVFGYPERVTALSSMANGELKTYLNDHLAGSVTGLELARHIASENDGTELGDFMREIAREIDEDRKALKEIMDSAGAGTEHHKLLLAWVTQKASMLKTHSPLSGGGDMTTFLELEMLFIGITGKQLLWKALAAADGDDPRLQELIERADRQREGVERHRLEAARAALAQ